MGQNTYIYLPIDTSLDNIARVVGILVGQKSFRRELGKDSWSCKVEGVDGYNDHEKAPSDLNVYYSGTSIIGMCRLNIKTNPIDNVGHMAHIHLINEQTINGSMVLSGGSNDFWRQIGKALVEFFGGYVDYNDCDNIERDFEAEKPRRTNYPQDGEEWREMQQSILDLKSLA